MLICEEEEEEVFFGQLFEIPEGLLFDFTLASSTPSQNGITFQNLMLDLGFHF